MVSSFNIIVTLIVKGTGRGRERENILNFKDVAHMQVPETIH